MRSFLCFIQVPIVIKLARSTRYPNLGLSASQQLLAQKRRAENHVCVCSGNLQVDLDEEEFRYVPDLTLRDLHAEIAELDKAKDDRKRK